MILLRGVPAAPALLALVATHMVISMAAPPVKRSPEVARDLGNGFSSVPKILEIQLPLKIATKDDLVAWAKYVMGLMASRINITLTTVKDTTQTPAEPARTPSSYKQMQSYQTSGFKNLDPTRQAGIMKAYAKTFETSRYAENVRNHERNKNPAEFKIQDTNRYPERNRVTVNVTPAPRKEVVSNPSLQAFTAGPLTAKNFLGIRPTTFATLGITDHATVHSPLEITANINLARPEIKESLIKGTFDVANALKVNGQQFFVPTFPDFRPFSPKNIDSFNTEAVPPARTYLPVTTTTDNIRFPSDSFATRYFFDGVERNVTSNLGILPVDLRYTTISPVSFSEEIPLPVKSLELATRKNFTSLPKPILNVPFEAVITFTREATIEPTTLRTDNERQFAVPTRDPIDAFPPYFDNNITVMNESGQINVVFDDGSQVTEKTNGTRKSEKKKKKKKKEEEEESSKQKTKKEKTKKPSMLTQIIKAFAEMRKKSLNANNSLSADLSPPPLKPPLSFPLPPRQESTPPPKPQSYPQRQQAYPQRPPQTYPQRPQQTYPQRPQTYPPKPRYIRPNSDLDPVRSKAWSNMIYHILQILLGHITTNSDLAHTYMPSKDLECLIQTVPDLACPIQTLYRPRMPNPDRRSSVEALLRPNISIPVLECLIQTVPDLIWHAKSKLCTGQECLTQSHILDPECPTESFRNFGTAYPKAAQLPRSHGRRCARVDINAWSWRESSFNVALEDMHSEGSRAAVVESFMLIKEVMQHDNRFQTRIKIGTYTARFEDCGSWLYGVKCFKVYLVKSCNIFCAFNFYITCKIVETMPEYRLRAKTCTLARAERNNAIYSAVIKPCQITLGTIIGTNDLHEEPKFSTVTCLDHGSHFLSELRQGRRNLTSLAQELEDDDDDGNSSGEDKSEEKSEEDEGSNPKDDAEENEGSNSSDESSSDESDYSDEEEEGGSVQALINLLELAAPVLEDLSDPESDTDFANVLEVGIPLLEDLSNGDGVNPGIDVAGILVPILLQISGGPEGMGDSVAILTPLLQVLAPLVGPLSGPLLVPLSRQSSNAPGQGGSSSGNLITNLSGPLSEVMGPGKMSMIQSLIAGVVSSLSKNSGGGSDITSLVKAIVAGSVSGTSASSSGPRDSYGAPTSYGGDSYSYGGQPSRGENPIALLGSSVNDILNAILKIVASLINAIMGILGASSASAAPAAPASPPSYGAPSPYQAAPSRLTPPPRLTQNNSTRGTSTRGVRFFR
ncbi:uncharacterized protein LOC143353011 [Halictus rubicundus]|uniref:uncharacterized protein LOC143353011 n=1 Tax=Halictus rubicundus TaxID=77578 RepID=UPI0040352FF3